MDLVDERISEECLDGNISKKDIYLAGVKSFWTMPSIGQVVLMKLNVHASDAAIHTPNLVEKCIHILKSLGS